MDDKNNQAVVSIESHKINSVSKTEVDSARSCLSILSWDMQAQQIAGLCGLSSSSAILEEDAKPLPGSHADNLGHKTVRSLIESSAEKNGLGMSWDEFRPKLTARAYRDKFAIQENDYLEINSLIEDVKTELGRMPYDAAELHATIQKMLVSKIEQIKSEAEVNLKSLQEKQHNLIKENTRLSEESRSHQARMDSVAEESARKIQDAYREAAKKIEENEQQAEAKREELKKQLEIESQESMKKLRAEMAEKMQRAEADILRVQNELNQVNAQIASGDLIKKEKIETLTADLERAVSQELIAQRTAEDLRSTIASLESRIEQMTTERSEFEAKLDDASAHIQELEGQLHGAMESRLNGPEFAIYQERLAHMREKNTQLSADLDAKTMLLEKAESERDQAKGRYQELHREGKAFVDNLQGQIQHYKSDIVSLNKRVESLNARLTAYQYESKSLKRALTVMSVMILVAGSSLFIF